MASRAPLGLCLLGVLAFARAGQSYDPLSQATHPVHVITRSLHRDRWDHAWFCQKDSDCNLLGRCDLITGKCLCHVTYFGQRCEYKRCAVSTLNQLECAGHGACIARNNKAHTLPAIHTKAGVSLMHGTCSCEAGWTGPACETRVCREDCSRYGQREGTCKSDTGKFGAALTFDHDYYSTCDCHPSAFGRSCEFRRCPVSPRGFECDTATSTSTEVHGVCDRQKGVCACAAGSYGTACELRVCPGQQYGNLALPAYVDRVVDPRQSYPRQWPLNARTPENSCWNQGECDPQLGECRCFPAFFGEDCSLRHCPNSTRGFVCDGAGTCDHESGTCVCSTSVITPAFQTVQAYGKDCSLRTCPLVNGRPCDGQGICDKNTGLCQCFPGRYGPACELRQCPRSRALNSPDIGFEIECSNHGTCDGATGRCKCSEGFYGADCALAVCPLHLGQMCNNEGSCVNEGTLASFGKCKCNPGFYGESCELRYCPTSGNKEVCSGNGVCDDKSGNCRCSAGFYGKDCALKSCPEHNGRTCNLNGKCVKESTSGSEFGDVIGSNDVGDGMDLVMGPDGRSSVVLQNDRGFPVKQMWSGSAQGRCLCDSGFYGPACEFRVCPVSSERKLQCDGHGACFKDTGYCKCQYGYFGADCSIGSCPEYHGNPCNGQGECRKAGTIGGTLSTADHVKSIPWNSDQTLIHSIYDKPLQRGYAVPDTVIDRTATDLGYCICQPPFYGNSCEKKRCPFSLMRQLECDGNGICDTGIGQCQCNVGWYGKDCSYKRCPEHNGRVCNLQGDCVKSDKHGTDTRNQVNDFLSAISASTTPGQCRCNFPYYGPACQFKSCPNAWPSNPSNVEQTTGSQQAFVAWTDDERANYVGLLFVATHRGPGSESCGKHGTCDARNGQCTCDEGYQGTACEIKDCPHVDGRTCNLQGKCIQESKASAVSKCQCTFPYYGEACEYQRCPTSVARPANIPWGMARSEMIGSQVEKSAVGIWGFECDGHGTCNHNTGRCTCQSLWSGESCQKRECPKVNGFYCNKMGTCITSDQSDDKIGKCVCTPPMFGPDCSKKRCPTSSSNHGSSWHGMNRNQECDGNGVCNYDTGRCNCDTGFTGLDCSVRRNLCPLSNKNTDNKYKVCNGEGSCNTNTGLCQCYSDEYSGLDCSYRRCPFYPDINGLECNGHGDCIQGFDARGQWTGICQCETQWSGRFCHEHYVSTGVASSTPPPSFWELPPTNPGGTFITDPRRHFIMGSEGRKSYQEHVPPGWSQQPAASHPSVLTTDHSYQSEETKQRAANYVGGQHPTNQNCHGDDSVSDMRSGTGCQHSVVHPEPFTGKATAQPSELSNYDKPGSHTNLDTLGQEQPTGFVSSNSGH